MASCNSLIAADLDSGCVDISKGFERTGYIINREDIDMTNIAYDTTNKHTLTTMPLKSGKQAYEIIQPSKTPFTGTTTAYEEGTYVNSVTHTISFVFLKTGEAAANAADAILNGEFVIILQNKNGEYEVYGLKQGLVASDMQREAWSDDTRGGWLFTLTESQCPAPMTFADASVITALG